MAMTVVDVSFCELEGVSESMKLCLDHMYSIRPSKFSRQSKSTINDFCEPFLEAFKGNVRHLRAMHL
jgi:hypothetical protein